MGKPRLSAVEREVKRRERVRRSFSDESYQHYDPFTEGFGSAQEWAEQAERVASGRGTYKRPAGVRSDERRTPDMVTMELDHMPLTIEALKSAFRKMALKLHPDHGGNPEAFKKMFAAYERLVRFY